MKTTTTANPNPNDQEVIMGSTTTTTTNIFSAIFAMAVAVVFGRISRDISRIHTNIFMAGGLSALSLSQLREAATVVTTLDAKLVELSRSLPRSHDAIVGRSLALSELIRDIIDEELLSRPYDPALAA